MYGKTKLLGEEYVQKFCSRWFIVRTAWLYGYVGKNFVKTMVNAGKKFGALTVVNDQLGNPTNAADLAHHLLKLAVTEEFGVCTEPRRRVLVVRLCQRDHPSRGSGRDGRALHERRVQGEKSRVGRPPRVERTGQPACCAGTVGDEMRPGATRLPVILNIGTETNPDRRITL